MNTNKKYLSPYKRIHGSAIDEGYIRNYIGGSGGFMVWKSESNSSWRHAFFVIGGNFPSLEKAKEHMDEKLLEEGYVLLTEEQYEKYQLLC